MGSKPAGHLIAACSLAFLLQGCVTPDTSQTATLASVSRNAAQFGAETRRFGDSHAVVTYAGQSRGFMSCVKRSTDVTNTMVLDSRSEVKLTTQGVSVETFYVATTRGATMPGEATPVSVTFTRTGGGRFGEGTICRATGLLEQALLSSG